MKIPRMRTAEKALNDIKAVDPNTAITLRRIREIIASGEINVFQAGKKKLFDLDALIEYITKGGNIENHMM